MSAAAALILGLGRCKYCIVEQQLTENKGQVVYLKDARVALRIAEGDNAGDERTDARGNAVVRYLEQHNEPVRRTESEREKVDSFYPEHVDRRDRRQHRDGLKEHL